jgi:alpha-galactosidase
MKTTSSIDIRDAWDNHLGAFAKAVLPGVGFSFQYDGQSIGPQMSGEWRRTFVHDAQSGLGKTILTHESGLLVTREMRVFAEYGAVEYRVKFKNAGEKTLPAVSRINALNISFGAAVVDGNSVISSGGGLDDATLPPRNFALRRTYFAPTTPDDAVAYLSTEGGRSSNKDMPFFFVHNDLKQEGVFVALGWSGQWQAFAALHRPEEGTMTLRGKIPDVDIALEPGEEIEGATVLIGLYQGAIEAGSNQLRRLIRDRYTPRLAGEKFLPATTYDHFWNIYGNFDESVLKKLADGAAAIDQEYFLLDDGWYEGDVWESVGNWEQVNTARLPNGLKPVADYVRSKGLKFGLWFEPERVAEDSRLAKEHPEWVLWDYGKRGETPPWFTSIPWQVDLGSIVTRSNRRWGLLDYGRPEVQEWVGQMMSGYIRELDLRYIRYDFNMDPLPFWDAHDKPDRRGMTQLRHVQGLYAILDGLRERHPDLILEGCASGGRRIDLEMARRFHTFWISDYTVDPAIVRFHLFGLHTFLPGNYSYVQYTLPHPRQKNFQPDDLGFQSMFGGAMGTGGHVDLWSEEMKEKARGHFAVHKKIRRYLVEDYYPLSEQPGDLKSWSGWQFNDPLDRSGFVQTFRTHTPDATHRFFLKGLEEQARYRFIDAYTAEEFELIGSTAMAQGIAVTQAPMTSSVLSYKIEPG